MVLAESGPRFRVRKGSLCRTGPGKLVGWWEASGAARTLGQSATQGGEAGSPTHSSANGFRKAADGNTVQEGVGRPRGQSNATK